MYSCSLFNLVSVSCFVIITYCWCFELTNHFFPSNFPCLFVGSSICIAFFFYCFSYYWCMFDIFNILEEHTERFMRIPWEATDFCSPWEEHHGTSNRALNVITRKIGSHCTPKKMLLLFLILFFSQDKVIGCREIFRLVVVTQENVTFSILLDKVIGCV